MHRWTTTGPSPCLRWEAKVIFHFKSCTFFNGRIQCGSNPSFPFEAFLPGSSPIHPSAAEAPRTLSLLRHLSEVTCNLSCIPPGRRIIRYTTLCLHRTAQRLLHMRHQVLASQWFVKGYKRQSTFPRGETWGEWVLEPRARHWYLFAFSLVFHDWGCQWIPVLGIWYLSPRWTV